MSDDRRRQVWDRRAERAADKWTHHPFRQAVKWALGLLVAFALLSLVGNALGIVNVYWHAEVAEQKRPARERLRIQTDVDRTLREYERFHEQCEDVVRLNRQVSRAEADAKALAETYKDAKDPFGQNAQEIADTRRQASALADQRDQVAADYNARARQQKTAGQFRDAGLPYQIEPPYENVACGTGGETP
jgi:hypothetical protein